MTIREALTKIAAMQDGQEQVRLKAALAEKLLAWLHAMPFDDWLEDEVELPQEDADASSP